MRNLSRSDVLRGLVSLGAAGSLPRIARAQNFNLSIGHPLTTQDSIHIGALRFKEYAEHTSGGRIAVKIFPGGVLGSSREMAQQVRQGEIFGIIDATAKFQTFVPEFALLDIPFLANDAPSAFKTMDSATVAHLIGDKSAKAGFRLAHGWEVSFRDIYTKSRPIRSMADLKGLKIRVIPAPTYINLFKAFGAAPTPMDFGELYTALQQGVVDGAENDILTYQDSKHFEVAPLLAITKHMMLINALFVSESVWNSMPADIRGILTAASLEGRKATMVDRDRRQSSTLDHLKSAAVKISQPDLAPFIQASEQTRPWFVEKFGKEAVQSMVDTKAG
ncbi:MAG TPA: TRAP transporter substrate-binding protein [Xanthobacteraceae bacterium]|nr:TRAP transporter substrate-binding protein [Xanthobacteraceae bacterium]